MELNVNCSSAFFKAKAEITPTSSVLTIDESEKIDIFTLASLGKPAIRCRTESVQFDIVESFTSGRIRYSPVKDQDTVLVGEKKVPLKEMQVRFIGL